MGGAQHSAFKQLRDATAAAAELLPGAILTTSDTAAADTRRQRGRKRTDRAEQQTARAEEPKRKDPRTAANTAKEGLQAQTGRHRAHSRGERVKARMTKAPGRAQQMAATRTHTPRRQRAKRERPLPDDTERSATRTAPGLGRGRGMTLPAWQTLVRALPDPSWRLGRNTTTGAGAAPTVEAPTATTAAAAATAKNSAAGSRKRARTELPAKGATAEKKMAREGAAAAEIEKTAPAARRGPKQPPAPTEQSGATAAKPRLSQRPAGMTRKQWRNYTHASRRMARAEPPGDRA
jgi:hypothetical protein